MPLFKDKTNIRYSRLVVQKFAGWTWDGRTLWFCKCDCGKEIIIRGSSLQNNGTKSCGCFRREVLSKKDQIGKNNPNYINGKYCRWIKEEIRKRDSYTCQNCSKTQEQNLKETGRILDVHHIDGIDINNVEENMITLCTSCHLKERKLENY